MTSLPSIRDHLLRGGPMTSLTSISISIFTPSTTVAMGANITFASPTTVAMGATINFHSRTVKYNARGMKKGQKKGIFCNVFKVLCM